MKPLLPALLLGLGLSAATITPAAAYPVDCAILLCLAGGFPPSEPCNAAYTEMIRRITPWPIEPPLQLWRCPMQAGLVRPRDVASKETREIAVPRMHPPLRQSQLTKTVSLFIASNTIEGYLATIKVYDLTYRRHDSSADDSCNISGRFRIGSYNADGAFGWRNATFDETPAWLLNANGGSCSDVLFRAVGMEWTDYFGKRSTETVLY